MGANYYWDAKGLVAECSDCGKAFDLPITSEQFYNWQKGMLIQNAMPNISAGQRELLISGICNTCWQYLFAEDRP